MSLGLGPNKISSSKRDRSSREATSAPLLSRLESSISVVSSINVRGARKQQKHEVLGVIKAGLIEFDLSRDPVIYDVIVSRL